MRDWVADDRPRNRAGNVSRGVAGNTLRQASLPCLDTKMSCLAPSVDCPWSLVAYGCFLTLVDNSKVFPTLRAVLDRRRAEDTRLDKVPGRSVKDRDASGTGKDLAKSSHPHARGAKPDPFTEGNRRWPQRLDQKYTAQIGWQQANEENSRGRPSVA